MAAAAWRRGNSATAVAAAFWMWQLGGGAVAAAAWRQRWQYGGGSAAAVVTGFGDGGGDGGSDGSLAAAAEALRHRLGTVVAVAAAAWQQQLRGIRSATSTAVTAARQRDGGGSGGGDSFARTHAPSNTTDTPTAAKLPNPPPPPSSRGERWTSVRRQRNRRVDDWKAGQYWILEQDSDPLFLSSRTKRTQNKMVLFSERIFARELIPFWEKKGQTNPYLQKVCFFMYREISKFAYQYPKKSRTPKKTRTPFFAMVRSQPAAWLQ